SGGWRGGRDPGGDRRRRGRRRPRVRRGYRHHAHVAERWRRVDDEPARQRDPHARPGSGSAGSPARRPWARCAVRRRSPAARIALPLPPSPRHARAPRARGPRRSQVDRAALLGCRQPRSGRVRPARRRGARSTRPQAPPRVRARNPFLRRRATGSARGGDRPHPAAGANRALRTRPRSPTCTSPQPHGTPLQHPASGGEGEPLTIPAALRFAVLGAGMPGILAALRLREAGYDDVVVYEKADRLGGTWRENTYPGLSCDVPSHFYSYSFAPNPEWTHRFSPGPEILAYFEDVARRWRVDTLVRYGCEVTRCAFERGRWRLGLSDGSTDAADF